MHEKNITPFVGVAVIAGIGIQQISGFALTIAVVSLVAIVVAILVISYRVNQLVKDTASLTSVTGELRDKVDSLEETMNQSSVDSR